jgi:hypothetical protein
MEQELQSHRDVHPGRTGCFPGSDERYGVTRESKYRGLRSLGCLADPCASNPRCSAAYSGETSGAGCGWNKSRDQECASWQGQGHQGWQTAELDIRNVLEFNCEGALTTRFAPPRRDNVGNLSSVSVILM